MNAANQGWLVARREMRERARSRGFRISVLLMLLVVVAMVVLPGMLDTAQTTKNVGITGATSAECSSERSPTQGDSVDATIHAPPLRHRGRWRGGAAR